MYLASLRRVAARLGAAGLVLTGCGPDDAEQDDAEQGDAEPCVVSLADLAQGDGGFVVDGREDNDLSGMSVAGVGDMNGDGLDDALIGAQSYFNEAGYAYGRPAVVFGKADTEPVELSDVAGGQGGFLVDWEGWDGYGANQSVSGAGDVNGDGVPDAVVGRAGVGATHVVFGKADTEPVSLEEIDQGQGGFVIRAAVGQRGVGAEVAGTGDVNGDGVPDLIIGAGSHYCPTYGPCPPDNTRTYVVFGKADTEPVLLTEEVVEGPKGFVLEHELPAETRHLVAGPGDMNGDGLADVVVSDPREDVSGKDEAGRTYVVFGKLDAEPVQLADVAAGLGGFVVDGEEEGYRSGAALSGAGDLNGDGLADLLVGAPSGLDEPGRVYVVFGKADTEPVSLADVAEGTGGFVVKAGEDDYFAGVPLASGDINGDGLPDLFMGSPGAAVDGDEDVGRVYVVFGKTDTEPVSLDRVTEGQGGFVLDGETENDHAGWSVSNAGDANGDGVVDLLIGAPDALSDHGRTYVVFGHVPDCATGE